MKENVYRNMGNRNASTPQTEPIPGSRQTKNHAGGYTYTVDDMIRLQRFLILGSDQGTYYVGAKKLTKENLEVLERLLRVGKGHEVVDLITSISVDGRATSEETCLFALARCCAADVHGMVTQNIPSERTYTMHRIHHEALFEQFPQEGVVQERKNGSEQWVRHGDVITRTVQRSHKQVQTLHPADLEVRQLAFAALPKVVRTGSHLEHFVAYLEQFRGWGRGTRTAIANWFLQKEPPALAYQMVKYQQRDGWSERDVLRLSHPKTGEAAYNVLLRWVTQGDSKLTQEERVSLPQLILAFEQAKGINNEHELSDLIKSTSLPREAVPTEHLHSKAVWEALLQDMPMGAMVRNLGVMTKEGALTPTSTWTQGVIKRLENEQYIQKARLHPIKVLAAQVTYASGKGVKGQNSWTPVQRIVDALDGAFYLSFKNVEPTNKRILVAVDVSGSMTYSGPQLHGLTGMSLMQAAGAMALVLLRTEPYAHVIGVDTRVHPIAISSRQRLDDVVKKLETYGGGGTDLSLPFESSLEQKVEYDAILILTDSETWAGGRHAVQALEEYRRTYSPDCKVITVQMTSTDVTINDPNDRRTLDVAGFDTNVPMLVHDFLLDRI